MKRRVNTMVGKCHAGNTEQCILCGYTIGSETGMKLHMKVKHNVLKVSTNQCSSCFACKKDFGNYGSLLHHLKKDHY